LPSVLAKTLGKAVSNSIFFVFSFSSCKSNTSHITHISLKYHIYHINVSNITHIVHRYHHKSTNQTKSTTKLTSITKQVHKSITNHLLLLLPFTIAPAVPCRRRCALLRWRIRCRRLPLHKGEDISCVIQDLRLQLCSNLGSGGREGKLTGVPIGGAA
jgi:hypothetical protein